MHRPLLLLFGFGRRSLFTGVKSRVRRLVVGSSFVACRPHSGLLPLTFRVATGNPFQFQCFYFMFRCHVAQLLPANIPADLVSNMCNSFSTVSNISSAGSSPSFDLEFQLYLQAFYLRIVGWWCCCCCWTCCNSWRDCNDCCCNVKCSASTNCNWSCKSFHSCCQRSTLVGDGLGILVGDAAALVVGVGIRLGIRLQYSYSWNYEEDDLRPCLIGVILEMGGVEIS
jgi:hypothetical protein